MGETLTIKEVAKLLKMSPSAVRGHLSEWGFFRLKGSRVWRINRTDLDKIKIKGNNPDRLALSVDEVKLCQSSNAAKHIGLISQPQAVVELENLLARM
ncbi:MAG: helix-turn-helix domain-containing protein [Rodentibacter sp.]